MTSATHPTDSDFMHRALDLAALARYSTSPNPRVGCVITRSAQIVGEGFHLQAGTPHAEVHALRQAGELARGATAYVTLEPCAHFGRTPPCSLALIQAGIARVVVAMQDPNPLVSGKGLALLREANIAVQCGVSEHEARALNRGFLSRFERGRPFLSLKMGVSLDGKIALSNGQSQWITGCAARADVQTLRAQSCGILTGINTILADNPQLNVRAFATLRQPVRIILDTHFRLPEHSTVVQDGGATWLFTAASAPAFAQHYPQLKIFRLPENAAGKLDLSAVLATLAQEGIGELLVETGAQLTHALLQQDLIDEIVLYQAPKILGDGAQAAFRLPENAAALSQESAWLTQSVAMTGDDVKWVLCKRNGFQ